MKTYIYTLHAISPLHCGIGQIVNDIDLPTARNRVTGHPLVPGSSLKGVLKEAYRNGGLGKKYGGSEWALGVDTLFGHDENADLASAISIGDAALLALPVRSYFGTFAWLASPTTLRQFKSGLKRAGLMETLPALPRDTFNFDDGSHTIFVTDASVLVRPGTGKVVLEDLDLTAEEKNGAANAWAECIASYYFPDEEGRAIFQERFAIVHDDLFNFLTETALPVEAKIAIDDATGTVKNGALWYEESVPAETLFTGVVGVDRSRNTACLISDVELASLLTKAGLISCQVGGKATTGKGFVELRVHDGGAKGAL